MSAIRTLAAEAADNGLLAAELAAGVSRVKSAKTQGIRVAKAVIAPTSASRDALLMLRVRMGVESRLSRTAF